MEQCFPLAGGIEWSPAKNAKNSFETTVIQFYQQTQVDNQCNKFVPPSPEEIYNVRRQQQTLAGEQTAQVPKVHRLGDKGQNQCAYFRVGTITVVTTKLVGNLHLTPTTWLTAQAREAVQLRQAGVRPAVYRPEPCGGAHEALLPRAACARRRRGRPTPRARRRDTRGDGCLLPGRTQ